MLKETDALGHECGVFVTQLQPDPVSPMKSNRIVIFGTLALCAITAITVGVWLARSSVIKAAVGAPKDQSTADHSGKEKSAGVVAKASPPQASEVRAGLEAILAGMQKAGARRIEKPDQALNEAIASKDRRAISQALSELIYSGNWSRDQMLTVLKEALKNKDPWLCVQAAERLYIIGDLSGRAELVKLLQRGDAITETSPAYASGNYDLRLKVAEIVAKFRDHEAAQSVLMLYKQTNNRALLDDLVKVGAPEAVQLLKSASGNEPSSELMELYGLSKATGEASMLGSVQRDESLDMPTRLAAAWANAQVSNDEGSAKFVRDFVESQIAKLTVDLSLSRKAVQYLGTLNDAASISLLERVAKQSGSTDLVRVATANLILNHSDQSSAGTELVVAELTSKPTKLGIDLAVKLAAASTDPRLIQAGQSFDARREGERIWKQQGADRVQWSLWGWADDYVLALPPK